ncbi:hypothetical protein BT63DRAFT_460830 [Microthyrium microscopicum]|uniref:DUF4484 domain-containing protein n=1 Tax=Microthyrium microscopicum TaxID=703497 RepID=A0A6A6TUF9_9PEZI|nr:hypothetical protein BT63DRAFT_460830 [Microthyrium microscopicum]
MSGPGLESSTHVEAGSSFDVKPPPLVALFLIKFDLKVGYTIAWKRAINDKVPLEGVVEYKSLPSGLHNVQEDLVYFFHEQCAGVSAFAKGSASEAERNAHFVAVGGMLPLKDSRLGRAWLHAGNLTNLAKSLVDDTTNTSSLEEYWEEHKVSEATADEYTSPQLSPFSLAQRKNRTLSTATLGSDDKQTLSAYHPALSLVDYINTFGPLIFPLHRAALLRKRILLVTSAPVRQACEFVYDLSVTTSTPISLASSLILPSESLVRLRPLFSVGIHDIPYLEKLSQPQVPLHSHGNGNGNTSAQDGVYEDQEEPRVQGWIACTTDDIIATKSKLFDIVVEMPSSHNGRKRPIIKTSDGQKQIQATQRDLRRWHMLKRALGSATYPLKGRPTDRIHDNDEEEPLLSQSASTLVQDNDGEDDQDVVEPTTWSALAYSSFYWWASAGQKDGLLMEEENQDKAIFSELVELAEHIIDARRYQDSDDEEDSAPERNISSPSSHDTVAERQDARIEMALIAYFHRITKRFFEVCSDILDDGADDNEGSIIDGVPNISREEMRLMGLDGWSKADMDFVRTFFELWYEREVNVDRLGIDCCGLRVY